MTDSAMDELFTLIQRNASSPVWSRGVQIARDGRVNGDVVDDDEVVFQIAANSGKLGVEVSLYPNDGEWCCDCPSRDDPCEHVAASIIAWRQNDGELGELQAPPGHVRYQLVAVEKRLTLTRSMVQQDSVKPLSHSLTASAAGQGPSVDITISTADLDVEKIMEWRMDGPISSERIPKLFRALARCRDVRYEGEPAQVSSQPVVPTIVIRPEASERLKVTLRPDPSITQIFGNRVALCGGVFRPMGEGGLSRDEIRLYAGGVVYGGEELAHFVAETLPELRRALPVDALDSDLPGVFDQPPRLLVETRRLDSRLVAEGAVVYGEPPVARMVDGELEIIGNAVPRRDRDAESRLARHLRRELGLISGHPAVLAGAEAIDFVAKLRLFDGECVGEGQADFTVVDSLTPQIALDGNRLDVSFGCAVGKASSEQVLNAWRRGESLVPLDDGGWAALPMDWLNRLGGLIINILESRLEDGTVPRWSCRDVSDLCTALDMDKPAWLDRFEPLLRSFEGLPKASLPPGAQVNLRDYQAQGLDWLTFLRQSGLGGLLADDMGLGKTVQALMALAGPALVVAPTSVLLNWKKEALRFRPDLKVQVYHGSQRKLDAKVDLTLTTYALLRMDIEPLSQVSWDTVILDEAQAIKNPDSQVARASYRLNATFRLALTGTPVENRLEELWSQFRFINPGLLGSRRRFAEETTKPIEAGQAGALSQLRIRLKPFILRRLKRDVASELPPRTEAVLHVALNDGERAVYDALRLAAKKDVAAHLGAGGSVMKALEALLRLRQAACHTALVPGQEAAASSKVTLLVSTLEKVVAEGHKALVFSQWTSLLDKVEPHLTEVGLPYLRLDGTTRDRQAVVDAFQDDEGPPVMLISLKAGGSGLNLTAADHVFLLDPWWNPAVEAQAADRAHRIGQERPVFIYRLVAMETVEERILALQEKKRALAQAALDGSQAGAALTRADILALLG
jgi:superfamily II DNA or RNA helicase